MAAIRTTLIVLLLTLMNAAFAAPQDVGIVLMHGKEGSPERVIDELASELRAKGYLVSTPVMPWSRGRIYDRTFEEALNEIDREVDVLRSKGAKKVVIAGQSLGANVALGYAAARPSVGGVIALAPGHNPESPRMRERTADDIKRARELVASGRTSEVDRFTDRNMGRSFVVIVTPQIYLSWFDPDGLAVMPRSASAIKQPVPLLFVVGSRDRISRPKEHIFDKAPPHSKSKYVTVEAHHLEVPSASVSEVISWLESLGD
jgi:pimeloyl-ACP methyl ester carboxylesterase